MLPGETILSGAPNTCPDCKQELPFRVLKSHAGFYIGTACCCGPYSRETDYYETRELAEHDLATFLGGEILPTVRR